MGFERIAQISSIHKMKKKIIYIQIDEDLTSIVDRLKKVTQKSIYFVVPEKAMFFQAFLNLKILNEKIKKVDKEWVLITTDSKGVHFAEKLGVKVYSRVEISPIKPNLTKEDHTSIQPIQAKRNEIKKETPHRFNEKRLTIGEYLSEMREKTKKAKDALFANEEYAFLHQPSRKFIAFFLLIALGLFFLVTYIALPGATIYIRPKFDDVTHSANIILAEKRKNQNLLKENEPHVVSSERITVVTRQTKVFETASKQFEGTNARGKIKIINSSEEEWSFKAGTRFQNKEGLIFRTNEGIIIPPAERDETGEKVYAEFVVNVQADHFDIYGAPIGERGNIPPDDFFFPGLANYEQKVIWGKSEAPMQGGTTKFKKVVMEEDIEAAKNQIEDNLILMAKEELKIRVEEINQLNHTHLKLLDDDRYLKTQLLDLRFSDDLEGSEKEKFEIFAKMEAEGVAYDFDQLFSIMEKELYSRVHPQMEMKPDSVNPDMLTYEIIEEDELSGQIKITATIKGIEQYVISDENTAGRELSEKIKEKILGMNVVEAESLIGNFTEVDNVQIKTWPIWISTTPRVPENIKLKMMED